MDPEDDKPYARRNRYEKNKPERKGQCILELAQIILCRGNGQHGKYGHSHSHAEKAQRKLNQTIAVVEKGNAPLLKQGGQEGINKYIDLGHCQPDNTGEHQNPYSPDARMGKAELPFVPETLFKERGKLKDQLAHTPQDNAVGQG